MFLISLMSIVALHLLQESWVWPLRKISMDIHDTKCCFSYLPGYRGQRVCKRTRKHVFFLNLPNTNALLNVNLPVLSCFDKIGVQDELLASAAFAGHTGRFETKDHKMASDGSFVDAQAVVLFSKKEDQ